MSTRKLTFIIALALAMAAPALYAKSLESTDPKPFDKEAWEQITRPVAGWGSIDVKYPRSLPADMSKSAKLGAWRGERVSAQAVVSTPREVSLKVSSSDLRCGRNIISKTYVTTYFVTYTLAGKPKDDASVSLQPDRLDPATTFDVPANTTRPIWVKIKVPCDAKPGLYKGVLTVDCGGEVISLPYKLNVVDWVLPEPSEWSFHLDLWQNPYAFARYFGVPLWSEKHFALMRPQMEAYAAAGGKVITASIIQHPWNSQTYDPFESMIAKIRQIDGAWSYDYTVFDKWVDFMLSCGVTEQIDCYTLVPWHYKFDYYDCATNSVRYVECKPQEQAYRDLILPFLKDFAAHLKSRGWFDRTCIAMDERPMEQMNAAYAIVKEADPGYRIAGAANYSVDSEEAEKIYDMSVGYRYDKFSESAIARRRDNDQKLTFYTCCNPDRPNTFTVSESAESAFLGWHCAAVGYDGYLRWALCSWPEDPCADSRFGNWKSGDTYLIYPDVSSIRFERLIEGIQDYEKIKILRQSMTSDELSELDTVLKKFSPNKFSESDSAADILAEGKAVLTKLSGK